MLTTDMPLPPPSDEPLALLGGLTPAAFMRRYWQKKPSLIRAAIPGFEPLLSRAQLFALAAQTDVESRLVERTPDGRWRLTHGPFGKSAHPPLRQPDWTLLVQGVDLHDDAAHALLQSFRFAPDARIDDLMISWASNGGGVGPHIDSYDVFLLQAQGRRRWRISCQQDLRLVEDGPLKILAHFTPEAEYVLEAGDMLYLPPGWAHEGVADGGACMTYSIGFQARRRAALAADLLERMADDYDDVLLYRDPPRAATHSPGRIPAALQAFAADAVRRLLARPHALTQALGAMLTEPKPDVSFDAPDAKWRADAVVLDRRTRMMYDERDVFINGECHRATGADARLLRKLADERHLDAHAVRLASVAARSLLAEWFAAGWLHTS